MAKTGQAADDQERATCEAGLTIWASLAQEGSVHAEFFGFFYSRVARDADSYMADRVRYPQGYAGSLTRSINLHGLPPSLGRDWGRC